MNKYFLLVACLQLWPQITPVNPASTWGPLLFIFAVSAFKEGLDDYGRYKQDKLANEKMIWVVKNGIKTRIRSQDICVGDIIWLRENDEVPCDLVLLGASETQGFCYVETAALDGETDLKTRMVAGPCIGISGELLHKIKGVIECPLPDKDIMRFDGNLRLFPPFIDTEYCSLSVRNTILQSCVLRNTEWACGVAVYTGNETKLGMSKGVSRPKLTAADGMIDKLSGAVFFFQITVVLILGMAGNVWKNLETRKVEFILTDKTGTLTENVMVFKKCFINKVAYGNDNGDAAQDPKLLKALADATPEVVEFITTMAICNTVVPIRSENGAIQYKAASQDEEALVTAAAKLHVTLCSRQGSLIEVNFLGTPVQYELLAVLEFSSERKRMSIVVKEPNTGQIKLYIKGADEMIFSRLRADQDLRSIADCLEQYAQSGLRTLCFARRDITEEEYEVWDKRFREASASVTEREWKLAEVCELIERNLILVGATAIEDKLQEGVPQTIKLLRNAGIHFWMLTGDKYTTAVQIALACNFILPEPEGQLLQVQGRSKQEVATSLERVLRTMRITSDRHKDVAFIIEGWALEIALTYHRHLFTELSMFAQTAICCRVTPSQKAMLVELVKSCEYRTLAIGDGGNDVRMIQEAHVGVGISGREGRQAARAADYSIAKFRFLKRLILVHGRYSYHRTAVIAQYSFYKSLIICFIQIMFSFWSGISGSSLFNSFSLMAYNIVYTSLPVLLYVLDKDISEESVENHPHVMRFCQAGRMHLAAGVCCCPGNELIIIVGMGPIVSLKYFKLYYRASTIAAIQHLERSAERGGGGGGGAGPRAGGSAGGISSLCSGCWSAICCCCCPFSALLSLVWGSDGGGDLDGVTGGRGSRTMRHGEGFSHSLPLLSRTSSLSSISEPLLQEGMRSTDEELAPRTLVTTTTGNSLRGGGRAPPPSIQSWNENYARKCPQAEHSSGQQLCELPGNAVEATWLHIAKNDCKEQQGKRTSSMATVQRSTKQHQHRSQTTWHTSKARGRQGKLMSSKAAAQRSTGELEILTGSGPRSMSSGERGYDRNDRHDRPYDGGRRGRAETSRDEPCDADRYHRYYGQGMTVNEPPRRQSPICYGCKVPGHYRSDCWRIWADPTSRRQAEADGYICPAELYCRGRSVSPRRANAATIQRSPSIDSKTSSKLEELGQSVATLREFVDLEMAQRNEKEKKRREREEASVREEEERRAEAAKAARKAEKLRKREEEQLEMAKAVEMQLTLRLSSIWDDIRNEIRRAVGETVKGKAKLVEERPSTSGSGAGDNEVEVITEGTERLAIREKRNRGEETPVGNSPPVVTPAKRANKRTMVRSLRFSERLQLPRTRIAKKGARVLANKAQTAIKRSAHDMAME
ncbi:hypothetical protein CBR_g6606 [Chara braunii]|uniref:Phospholipid-transporting ATPase n=1 Tax=Chara braunii TaxID=69332 RepID=A0A388KKC0_CHABU|nr:hypothetical protein CBR_g6606 [Chara braunii]|eukprot:GBG70477.1 hypothetical protein CBR_g6606 [Chara braunii]